MYCVIKTSNKINFNLTASQGMSNIALKTSKKKLQKLQVYFEQILQLCCCQFSLVLQMHLTIAQLAKFCVGNIMSTLCSPIYAKPYKIVSYCTCNEKYNNQQFQMVQYQIICVPATYCQNLKIKKHHLLHCFYCQYCHYQIP